MRKVAVSRGRCHPTNAIYAAQIVYIRGQVDPKVLDHHMVEGGMRSDLLDVFSLNVKAITMTHCCVRLSPVFSCVQPRTYYVWNLGYWLGGMVAGFSYHQYIDYRHSNLLCPCQS